MRKLRYLVRRLPILYWVGALSLVLCTGLAMARIVGGAQTAAAQFGTLRPVPVASHDVPVGTSLDASDVRIRMLPRAVIPHGDVSSSTDAVIGHVALVPLSEGEVVTAAKVAPTGLTGITALLPDDARALAIPTTAGTPPLQRGDHVDLLASFDLSDSPGPTTITPSAAHSSPETAAPTFPVARHATVLDVASKAITVAVTADEAPRLAYALTHGAITLALTAP
ncbi:MAG: Flp pilus assembly protein CpaB [Actinobacteria bacterium]|nr:Flp pilus assembly protein CpaB [Actinomycetota bacterium]